MLYHVNLVVSSRSSFMNSARAVTLAPAPRPVSEPSRSWSTTCFGPSQSSTTHLEGTIQLRLGGGRSARLARESASMVMPEKKWGGTASDDSMPPRIVVCSTLLPPQLLPLSGARE